LFPFSVLLCVLARVNRVELAAAVSVSLLTAVSPPLIIFMAQEVTLAVMLETKEGRLCMLADAEAVALATREGRDWRLAVADAVAFETKSGNEWNSAEASLVMLESGAMDLRSSFFSLSDSFNAAVKFKRTASFS